MESIAIEGSLTDDAVADYHGRAYLLGIYRPGELASPDEIEPGHPGYFTAPRFAKVAGRALCERNAETLGFEVAYIFNGGHYRTVHTEASPA